MQRFQLWKVLCGDREILSLELTFLNHKKNIMSKKFAFLFLALTIMFSSCRKDIDTLDTKVSGDPDNPITSVIVTGNLVGNITDEYDNPVDGAVVRLKSNTAFTDENGNFSFNNVQMEDDGALITVDKSGFFRAFDRVRATENQTSYTRIQLLDRSIISSFPAGAASDVTFDGATVKFQSNGFVDANGADYNGTVNVAAHWIDPTSNVLEQQMPGDLRALDMENELAALKSFGMVAVDLIADNGTDLQLKDGMTAEVSFPIPAEILGDAPASIPLWSFDEEMGLWVEEGSASKVGNMYVGNVSHFSFWNCDAPFPLVEMEGQIVDENGNPLDGTFVCIDFADGSGYGAGGWTDEDGNFGGKIPKNELLILSVKDDCYDTVFSTEIGPFSADVDLGTITATGLTSSLVTVFGTLVDCDGNPVTNGYMKITSSNSPYYQYPVNIDPVDGSWENSFLVCESDIELFISGYDLDGPYTTEVTIVTLVPGTTTYDVGEIEACEEVEEFLNCEGGTLSNSFIDPSIFFKDIGLDSAYVSIQSGSPSTGGADSLSNFQLAFNMDMMDVGTYDNVQYLSYNEYDPMANMEDGYSCQGCDVIVVITLLEAVGGFVEGSYSGTAQDYSGTTINVNGDFRIRRD